MNGIIKIIENDLSCNKKGQKMSYTIQDVKFKCQKCDFEFREKKKLIFSNSAVRKRPIFKANCPKCGNICVNSSYPSS